MALLLRLNVIALTALLLVPAAAQAQERQRLDSTVAYLQKVQHKDGGFGERGSRPGFSTWAALALASAGINPRDQRRPGGVDVYTYLTRNTRGLTQSTDFASMILVATASGTSPHRFGPVDPIARLLKLQRADGGFPQPPDLPGSTINGSAYAVLALAGVERSRLRGVTAAQLRRSQDRALDWLVGRQSAEGLWQDTDLTGSVLEALNAGGRRNTAAQARAVAYLRSRQNADGGFGGGPGDPESNSASTAWVLRGLAAARLSARSFQGQGSAKTPLDYLASMQQSDGSVRYSATQDTNRVWITSFTTPALAGASLPLSAVDRKDPEDKSSQRDETPTRTRGDDGTQPGAGGIADGGDGDVTAGGGGEGAPLYTRPQPGSLGAQPGGERDTDTPSRATGEGEGEVAGESVAGKLVGRGTLETAGKGRSLGSAPGLRAAAAGGQAPTWLVTAIGVALLLSALGGIYLERRSPGPGKEES